MQVTDMKIKVYSITTIILSLCVYGYLVSFWFKPIPSAALLFVMIVFAVFSLATAIICIKLQKNRLSLIALIISGPGTAILLCIFGFMLIMGA